MPVYIPVPRVTFAGRQARPHPVLVTRGGLAGLGAAFPYLDSSTLQTIGGVIQKQEGYYPGTLAYRNNNPGNLVYAGQAGATLGAGGFAQFGSYDDGLNALYNQLQLYAGRGMTIQGMMNVYAPAGDGSNNPTLYANQVAGALGVSPDTSLLSLAGGGSSIDTSAAAVVTDSGVFSLDSFISSITTDPVLLGVGAGVAALLLYAAVKH